MTLAFAAAVGALAGYLACRWQIGGRLVDWVEAAFQPGWRSWRFWLAAPVAVVIFAGVWVVHPRRTLANVRAARQDRREPAPRFDPDWASKRQHTSPEEQL